MIDADPTGLLPLGKFSFIDYGFNPPPIVGFA